MKSFFILFTIILSFNLSSQTFDNCRPRSFQIGDQIIHGGSQIGVFEGVATVVEIDSKNKFIKFNNGVSFTRKNFFPQHYFCLYKPMSVSRSLSVGMDAMKYAIGFGVGHKISVASLNRGDMVGVSENRLGKVIGERYYKNGSTFKFVPYKSIKKYKGFRIGGYAEESGNAQKTISSSKDKYRILDITEEGYILIDKVSRNFYVPHTELVAYEPKISYSMSYNDLLCDMKSGQSFPIDKFMVEELGRDNLLKIKFEVENSILWGFDSESRWIELNKANFSQSVLDSMRSGEKISLSVLADILNRLLKVHSLKEKDKDLQIISCYPARQRLSSAVNDEERDSAYKIKSSRPVEVRPKQRAISR